MTLGATPDNDDCPIAQMAREWILRLNSNPSVDEACIQWRSLDPANEDAYQRAKSIWDAVPLTSIVVNEAWRTEAAEFSVRSRRKSWWYGVSAALAASIVTAVVVPHYHKLKSGLRLETRTAETQVMALEDGSRITVGARSGVDVRFQEQSRQVVLESGQAFFEVAPDKSRPFTVIAGRAEVRVTGTKFDVRYDGDNVKVTVLEGRVELRRRPILPVLAERIPEQVLIAGTGSELREGGGFTSAHAAAINAGEWRNGWLYYADAPLGEIVRDLSRYSETPIQFETSDVAKLRLTTSFRANDVDHFLSNLQLTLPVDVHRVSTGVVLVSRQ